MNILLNCLFFLLGASLAVPHLVIQESLAYVPYVYLLGLTTVVVVSSRFGGKLTLLGGLMLAGLLCYFGGVGLSLLSGTAAGAMRSPIFHHVLLPIPFFLLGYCLIGWRRDLLAWYIAGNGIFNVALAVWITQQTVKVEFYDAVQDIWVWTGNRAWVHPLTSEVVRATGVNVACFAACIGAMLVFGAKSWINKALLAVATLGFGYIAAITETRGVIMAMFLGLWAFVFRRWRMKVIWTVVIAFTSAVALVAAMLLLGYLSDRFAFQYQVEEGFTGRGEVWMERLERIANNPLGHGPNYINRGEASCHNQYIEMAFEYGVLPGLAFLAMVTVGLVGAYRIFRSNSAEPFEIGIASAFLALAAHGMTDSQMISAPITFWHCFMLLGAIVGRATVSEKTRVPGTSPVTSRPTVRRSIGGATPGIQGARGTQPA